MASLESRTAGRAVFTLLSLFVAVVAVALLGLCMLVPPSALSSDPINTTSASISLEFIIRQLVVYTRSEVSPVSGL